VIYTAQEIQDWDTSTLVEGRGWLPARPVDYRLLRLLERIVSAYRVLTGKYDALDWEEGRR